MKINGQISFEILQLVSFFFYKTYTIEMKCAEKCKRHTHNTNM